MTEVASEEPLHFAVRTPADIARLNPEDRRRLAAWLSSHTLPAGIPAVARRRRRRALVLLTGGVAFLVPWTIYLAATLPETERAHAWRIGWVGFDVALAVAFGCTAWFGWRARQIVITALVVTATLLLCDAWFDLCLSWGSPEQTTSIVTAAVSEVPVAVFLLATYHRILRSVTAQVWRDRGYKGDPPPLRRVPLLLSRDPVHHIALHRRASAGEMPTRQADDEGAAS
ncbi:MAG TPA: hypothetical protein VGS21_07065 [Acidimicrobiales bacterium]|nr:hypothetical protein [Acidimicrobiales bacterium]